MSIPIKNLEMFCRINKTHVLIAGGFAEAYTFEDPLGASTKAPSTEKPPTLDNESTLTNKSFVENMSSLFMALWMAHVSNLTSIDTNSLTTDESPRTRFRREPQNWSKNYTL